MVTSIKPPGDAQKPSTVSDRDGVPVTQNKGGKKIAEVTLPKGKEKTLQKKECRVETPIWSITSGARKPNLLEKRSIKKRMTPLKNKKRRETKGRGAKKSSKINSER